MAEDQLTDIFVPKFSRDTSRIKLGLGLVTSHNVVHQHGGTIKVESRVGQGTHVAVTLPERAVERSG
jgi:two-component system sensor histidine kinase ResE